MKNKVLGYLPFDTPPFPALMGLGMQQFITMFAATSYVALVTKMDLGATLLTSGLGTIIAILVTKRKIPMYYGSSFSYITILQATMNMYSSECFATSSYCPSTVSLIQVGVICTAVVELIAGLIVLKVGKEALDKVLPPVITGNIAIVIGIAIAKDSVGMASANWAIATVTVFSAVFFAFYARKKGLIGMLPILFGLVVGYVYAVSKGLVDFSEVSRIGWFTMPNITFPAFTDIRAWRMAPSIALVAIATLPESTAHLYQMSLYIDKLAKELKKEPLQIKKLLGLNLIADAFQDFTAGFFGGCPGTNYGENNSLMAITKCYSSAVLMAAGAISILMAFVGKLTALVRSVPVAVSGGLGLYLFGMIAQQGIALLQAERDKVDLVSSSTGQKQTAIGALILAIGIGGSAYLPMGMFPFKVPYIFPEGIPAILLAALVGISLNVLLVYSKKEKLEAKEEM